MVSNFREILLFLFYLKLPVRAPPNSQLIKPKFRLLGDLYSQCPIMKPKPKLANTFRRYRSRYRNQISKGESSYRYWNNLDLVRCIFSIIKRPLKPNLLPNLNIQGVLALCEFHYCEFHYCGFSKLLLKFG
jgi:hypothetical protein